MNSNLQNFYQFPEGELSSGRLVASSLEITLMREEKAWQNKALP
jgi:hypothetical protein